MLTVDAVRNDPRVQQFVQTNVGYYRSKWADGILRSGSPEAALSGSGFASWNWAAFLFTWAWLFYRKQYTSGAAVLIVFLGLLAAETVTAAPYAGAILVIAVLIGIFGNGMYLIHAVKHISAIEAATNDPESEAAMLAEAGGTSASLAVGLSIFVGLFMGGVNMGFLNLAPLTTANTTNAVAPHYSEELAETSAWWDGDGERLGIFVTPDHMGLLFAAKLEVSDRGVISGSNNSYRPLRVVTADLANDTWSFELIDAPGSIWTLRKEWDASRERFTLALFPPQSSNVSLGFVRRFTADEIDKLTAASVSLTPVANAPGNSAIEPATAPPTIAEAYSFTHADYSGTLAIGKNSDMTYDVIVQTISMTTGAMCKLGMAKATSSTIPTKPSHRYLSWNDGPNQCAVVVEFSGDSAVITETPQCTKYCEDEAQFGGSYSVSPQKPRS